MKRDYIYEIYSVLQTREVENYIIKEQGVLEFDLMYGRGRAVFEVLKKNMRIIEILYWFYLGQEIMEGMVI